MRCGRMIRIGVMVSGGGTNLQALIDNIESGYINGRIVGVVSNNAKAYALERAKAYGIDARYIGRKQFPSQDLLESAIYDFFSNKGAELLITAGFMVVLSADFIKRYKNSVINIHPSLIPAFCGRSFYGLRVHEAVIESGVKITGATVHFADEGTDTGPIILQKAVEVRDGDDALTLQHRVMIKAEHIILPEAVKLFAEGRLIIDGKRVRIKEE